MKIFIKTMIYCLLLVFCLISVSFAVDKSETEEMMMRQRRFRTRVEDYISAQKSNNREDLYQLFSPRFRNEMSFEDFQTFPVGNSIGLMAVFIEALKINGNEGVAYMADMSFASGLPTPRLARRKTQSWIWEEGDWYVNPASLHGDFAPVICGNSINPVKKSSDLERMPTFPPCGSSKRTPKPDSKN